MKTKLTALALLGASAFSLAPAPAQAGDKELALIGGLIGGVIIGSSLHEGRHHDYDSRRTVIVERRDYDHCDAPAGRWDEVTVRVWVPGCWVEERGHHGRIYRSYVPGHYEYRTDRVWVSYDRRDRRDREVGYGYGRRR
ncbi:MAG: hypothetical protein HY302_06750 [Opitutae bacterium]|nr:hypothetical protein [Opitutae bacterium]